ncbi:UNVERIFIED_CONTAM: hypothetical protein Sindi_2457200 [Sesamum indicum]
MFKYIDCSFEADSIIIRLKHLRKNLEEFDKKFGQLMVKAQIDRQVQQANLDTVQIAIRSTKMASSLLYHDLMEPIWKTSPSVMTCELREESCKPALRVQDFTPVAVDSSLSCTRPSTDSS